MVPSGIPPNVETIRRAKNLCEPGPDFSFNLPFERTNLWFELRHVCPALRSHTVYKTKSRSQAVLMQQAVYEGAMTQLHYDMGLLRATVPTSDIRAVSLLIGPRRERERDGRSRRGGGDGLGTNSAVYDNGMVFYGNLFYFFFCVCVHLRAFCVRFAFV